MTVRFKPRYTIVAKSTDTRSCFMPTADCAGESDTLRCVSTVESSHATLGAGKAADDRLPPSVSSTASPNHQESVNDIGLVIRRDMDVDAVQYWSTEYSSKAWIDIQSEASPINIP